MGLAFRGMWAAGALALAGVALAGCVGGGSHQVDGHFTVGPKGDGSFFAWTEITVDEDAKSADRATLTAVRLDLDDASQASDLSFMQSLTGEAVAGSTRQVLVQETSIPKGEHPIGLAVRYQGDLRPFFPDGHTIRIEWTGQTNPAFTDWPKGGIRLHVVATIEVD